MNNYRRLRLRLIHTANFVKSELTNYEDLIKVRPEIKKFRKGDAVIIRSVTGQQAIIYYGFGEVKDQKGKPHKFLDTRRIRMLDSAEWDGLKIADYGRQVGIQFVGLPTFDEHLKRILGAKLYNEVKENKSNSKK